ncbi:MAG: lamin tail domain-containing protein [bacterium]|nr:lamin tail domain-containing protein [bacterium]
MKEKIKKCIFRSGVIILIAGVSPLATHAQIIITEVMYDLPGTDAGREWIEIKNIGDMVIDLSVYKLFEAETNHKINPTGETLLGPNNFAVIADDPDKFKTDNPDWTGLIFDSAFSLNNSGETLVLRDGDLSDIDSISYSPSIGGQGDGMSLQKTISGWTTALPTPGQEIDTNLYKVTTASTTNTTDIVANATMDTTSSHSNQSIVTASHDSSELEVTAGRPRLGFVDTPLSFEARTKSAKNIPLGNAISSVWSMGDGTQKFGQFISHAYEFAGEYVVILNSQSGGASAVSKVKIKIVEPKPTINFASAEYIEIHNRDVYELNLGGFILETNGGRFIIPTDTIIPPYLSIKLPASVTKLSVLKDFVRIANPKGKILAVKSINDSALLSSAGSPLIILPEGMDEKEFIKKLNDAFKK